MPVKELDIDLPTIMDDIATSIASNAPGDVDGDYLADVCFQATAGSGCDVIYVSDKTDYTDLDRLDVDSSVVYASLWKVGKCQGQEELIVSEAEYTPGDSWQYAGLEAGDYEVRIRIEYNLTDPTATVEKEYTLCVTLDCCADKKDSLKIKLIEKIAKIATTIKNNGYIGKPTPSLYNSLYKLQLIQWALCDGGCCVDCDTYQQYKSTYDKIIADCGC